LKQAVANGSLKIEIFIVVFVIIDFFDGPFTVASAVLDLIQILCGISSYFAKRIVLMSFPDQNC
jgi:hypothetical protein